MKPFTSIKSVYAAIPRIECKRLCHGSCGPVPATRSEVAAIEAVATERYGAREDGMCRMLFAGTCTVYEARPLMCRIWGVVKKLRCPHGCEPERWLSDKEASRMIAAVQRLGGGVDSVLFAALLSQIVEVGT